MSWVLLSLFCVGGTSAWYNTSSLGNCVPNRTWDPMQSLDQVNGLIQEAVCFYTFYFFQIKFDSSIPSPPFSEGEYYTTMERNVSIEVSFVKI